MKNSLLAILMALSVFSMMAQEETILVNYRGASPTISDFAKAYLSSIPASSEVDECDQEGLYMYDAMKRALDRENRGLPMQDNETLIIDSKNGYMLYEFHHDDEEVTRIEMCYWNMAGGKQKLFACVRQWFDNGIYRSGQYDNRDFYRYNNVTKTMRYCSPEDIGINEAYQSDNNYISFCLPQTGKDIIVKWWNDNGMTKEKTLKWNGQKFSF